jgi:acetylglutamate kinase
MHMSYNYASAENPLVVKYGGHAMTREADPVLEEIAARWNGGEAIVLVHGGGPEIDAALARSGVSTQRVDGLRVTDAATLQIAEAVLCATINKRIVRALLALGVKAVGLCGQDGAMLVADRAQSAGGQDLGFVGDVTTTDVRALRALLDAGLLPVVAPVGVAARGEWALNVNADLAAGAIAAALKADAFVSITDVPRVYRDPDDPGSGIEEISLEEARVFEATGACRSSMKPKLRSAIAAVEGGVARAYICRSTIRPIAQAFAGDATLIS